MGSFTVPPELKRPKGDVIAARIEVPILIAMIYGIVELVRLGWSTDYYLDTYAAVLGGVAASVGLFTYFFLVSVNRKRSWMAAREELEQVTVTGYSKAPSPLRSADAVQMDILVIQPRL